MSKTLILLANGFEAVEASVFTDVLGWNKWEGDGSTDALTVGLHPQLQCTWNFTVTPEALISEILLDDFDALAIPGALKRLGFMWMALVKNSSKSFVILTRIKNPLQQFV